MYEEEGAKGTWGLPLKWRTCAHFLEALVYDFIHPKRSVYDTDDSTNTKLFCSFSLFGQGSADTDESRIAYDLNCIWGRITYLEVLTKRTKNNSSQ